MSEQSTNRPTITSGVKEKKPKRVAAGKRLGAISKQAKEAKRLEREAQRVANNTNQSGGMEADKLYFIGGLVAAGAACYLYLNKDKLINETILRQQCKRLPTISEKEEPPSKRKSKRIFDQ